MQRQHILIIEDEPLISGALRAKAELEGFRVSVAAHGRDGLMIALRDHPDFILLDIVMPEMDGIEVLKKLRKDKWGATAKVLLWTNLNDTDRMGDGLKYGVADYLVKSDWTPAEVIQQVKLKLGVGQTSA